MEVKNIFINYGITDFKQNPMSETDFIKKIPVRAQGCPDVWELRKYQLSSYQAAKVLNL